MEHPRDHGIPCEHCGLVSSAKLQSCEHRPHGTCPYEPQARAPRPASIPGLLMMAMGVVFLFVFGSLPFLLFPKGDTPVSGVLAGILALTFVFTISSIFILAGAAFTGLRRSLFHNRAQSRLVEIFSIFGIPLAHRMITLGEVIHLEIGVSSLPLSLAGFLMDRPLSVIPPSDWEPPPEVESKTLSKLKSVNAQLDRSISHALLGAILHLAARSCIMFRSARQEIFSRWYTTPSLATYYIQAGEGSSDGLGLLEADLLNKVLNWRHQEWKVDDTVAPTFPDLIKTGWNILTF